jgi:hypothetical protein
MPSYPADVNDTLVYQGTDIYIPKDSSVTVFEDSRLFLSGEVYLNGQPVMAGPSAPSGIEVYVGPTQPTDLGVLLWWDIYASSYGALKVRTADTWKLADDPQKLLDLDEVWVGPTDPGGSNYQLWADTATGVFKAKSSGSWVSFAFGPQGPVGPPGPQVSFTQTVETVTGNLYSVAPTDSDKIKRMTGIATVTLPYGALATGQHVDFVSIGAPVTFVLGSGATWDIPPTPSAVSRAIGSVVSAIKTGGTNWILTGDLA